MDAHRLRAVAVFGVALAAIGLLVPGFHHVRCMGILTSGSGTGESDTSAACEETFPRWIATIASIAGLVGGVIALGCATMLARTGRGASSRILLAVASLSLLVPTVLPLATWAWVGFDLSLWGLDKQCRGGAFHEVPLWIQHPTCVSWQAMVVTPGIALAGAFALASMNRPARRIIAVALVILALCVVVAATEWLTRGPDLALAWVAPLLGGVLLAGSWHLAPVSSPKQAA